VKLINAYEIVYESIDSSDTEEYYAKYGTGILAVRKEDIDEMTTIEPQIVRCKDCKYWVPYDWMFSEVWQSRNIADYSEDEIGCKFCDMTMKANDFCSRGERRTE
jgi:hypothetical protein